MKTIALFAITILVLCDAHAANVLEKAIMTLPPKAVAGLPTVNRQAFIDVLKKDIPSNKRLDIARDYLEFYSDSTTEEFSHFKTPHYPSSMFYVKIFWIKSGGYIVVCCVPNPKVQILAYRRQGGNWMDITQNYIPDQVRDYPEVKPCRANNIIEIGINKPKHGGYSHLIRRLDLKWDGKSFKVLKAANHKFTDDGL